jgi:hypothetical protein
MSEHPLAGETVTLLIDGEEKEYQLEEGISQEKAKESINEMLGVDAPEPPTDVKHPDLEFAEVPLSEHPETEGLRTVCRIDGCEHTEVFDTLDGIKDSEWTELGLPKGLLTDGTDLHYAYCPHHSLSEDEGYTPEDDMASHQFNNGVPNSVREGLDE